MNPPPYRVAQLTREVNLRGFDCGEPDFNRWLSESAWSAVKAGASAVYVLIEHTLPEADERVVGYFAFCPTMVIREKMPKPLQRGALRQASGWLLAKLALDRSLRDDKVNQWGSQLLREALETIVASSDQGGGQVIVVDADNAGLVDWYIRNGFLRTGGSDLRLYMKVATARHHLRDR